MFGLILFTKTNKKRGENARPHLIIEIFQPTDL